MKKPAKHLYRYNFKTNKVVRGEILMTHAPGGERLPDKAALRQHKRHIHTARFGSQIRRISLPSNIFFTESYMALAHGREALEHEIERIEKQMAQLAKRRQVLATKLDIDL